MGVVPNWINAIDLMLPGLGKRLAATRLNLG